MENLDCLVIGDIVELNKDKKGYKAKAEIKFIGEVKDKEGIFYGVSVDKIWKGKHNGTFKNIKYFETDQQRGLFVKSDRITKFLEASKECKDKRITINDSVSIAKLECQGIVRFIGNVGHKPGIFYGIELQTNKGKNNGTVKGRTYFKCNQNYGIFLKLKEIERIAGGGIGGNGGGGLPAPGNDNNFGLPPAPSDIPGNNNNFGPPPPPSDAIQNNYNNNNVKKLNKQWPPPNNNNNNNGMPPPAPGSSEVIKKSNLKPKPKPKAKAKGKPKPVAKKKAPAKKAGKKAKSPPPPAPKKKAGNNGGKKKKGAGKKKAKPPKNEAPGDIPGNEPDMDMADGPGGGPGAIPGGDPGGIGPGAGGDGGLPPMYNEEDGQNNQAQSGYDYRNEPGYTDPGSVHPPSGPLEAQNDNNYEANNDFNGRVGPFAQQRSMSDMDMNMNNVNNNHNNMGMLNRMGSYPQPGYGQNAMNMSPIPSPPIQPMQPPSPLFNQPNVMAMQQNILKMQQDMINNPQLAGAKWANSLDQNQDQNPNEVKIPQEIMKQIEKPKFGMFGENYFKIEGILRVFGSDDESCKFYINRMRANNIDDESVSLWDTTNDLEMFTKIFPVDIEIRNRFRAWIRYDVQGYVASFKPENKPKDVTAKFHRKTSYFSKKKDVEEHENEIIQLNIAGIRYTTLKSTLVRSGSGYFKKLMKKRFIDQNENHGKKKKHKDNHLSFDKDGNHFIDGRDGKLFEPILYYLQSGKLVLNYKKYTLDEIKNEFKFYDIHFPKESHKLPTTFRFEYSSGTYCFNWEQQKYDFTVSDFQIMGPNKKTSQIISKFTGIEWPESINDIEQFLQFKSAFLKLGYKVINKTRYESHEKEHSNWINVEYYQKYIWNKKK